MELIKTYVGEKALKHWQYDSNDKDEFIKDFKIINEALADRLCAYLKKEKKVVDVIECYDSQSGWRGADFNIDGQNLSLNGYCLSVSSIDKFLVERGF